LPHFQDVVLCFDNDDADASAGGMPPKSPRYKSVPALLRGQIHGGKSAVAQWTVHAKDIDDMVKGGHVAELLDAINNARELVP
jgi:hypothetical protein